MMMKYVENPHASEANRAVGQRIFMQRHMMKNPSIMAKSRLAGDGKPSV